MKPYEVKWFGTTIFCISKDNHFSYIAQDNHKDCGLGPNITMSKVGGRRFHLLIVHWPLIYGCSLPFIISQEQRTYPLKRHHKLNSTINNLEKLRTLIKDPLSFDLAMAKWSFPYDSFRNTGKTKWIWVHRATKFETLTNLVLDKVVLPQTDPVHNLGVLLTCNSCLKSR